MNHIKVEANRMFQPDEDLDIYRGTETTVELVRRGKENKGANEVVIVEESTYSCYGID